MKIRNIYGNVYSGALGESLIASSWKGKDYIRSYTKPRNPRTVRQQANRALFAEAVEAWRRLAPGEKRALDRQSEGMSGFNLFIGRFLKERKAEAQG